MLEQSVALKCEAMSSMTGKVSKNGPNVSKNGQKCFEKWPKMFRKNGPNVSKTAQMFLNSPNREPNIFFYRQMHLSFLSLSEITTIRRLSPTLLSNKNQRGFQTIGKSPTKNIIVVKQLDSIEFYKMNLC
jgi:hypothetical protein